MSGSSTIAGSRDREPTQKSSWKKRLPACAGEETLKILLNSKEIRLDVF